MVKDGHVVREVPFDRRDRPTGLIECLPLRALFRRAPAAHWTGLESLQFHLWVFVTAGRCQHLVDFQRHRCGRGTVLHVAPGQVHRWDRTPGLDGFALIVGLGVLTDASLSGRRLTALDLDEWPTTVSLSPRARSRSQGWLQQLVELDDAAAPARRAQLWHLAMVALFEVLEAHEQRTARPESVPPDLARLRQFRQLIERSFRVTRAARDYADGLGCSVRTLDRTCLTTTGRTAKELVDARVLLEAKRRLAHSDVTLESLSDELGFSEATNFAKFFKQRAGVPAGSFRRPFRARG